MTRRFQIVRRLPVDLNRPVRAVARPPCLSRNTWLVATLTRAVAAPRGPRAKAGA